MRYSPARDAAGRAGRPSGPPQPRRFFRMIALLNLVDTVIRLYIWVLIASVVMSWLINFNVINTRNRFVFLVGDFLYRVTEPALRPIRNFMPSLGGIDISPIVLILLLYFLRDLLWELFVR
jgi:YggT family protein